MKSLSNDAQKLCISFAHMRPCWKIKSGLMPRDALCDSIRSPKTDDKNSSNMKMYPLIKKCLSFLLLCCAQSIWRKNLRMGSLCVCWCQTPMMPQILSYFLLHASFKSCIELVLWNGLRIEAFSHSLLMGFEKYMAKWCNKIRRHCDLKEVHWFFLTYNTLIYNFTY